MANMLSIGPLKRLKAATDDEMVMTIRGLAGERLCSCAGKLIGA